LDEADKKQLKCCFGNVVYSPKELEELHQGYTVTLYLGSNILVKNLEEIYATIKHNNSVSEQGVSMFITKVDNLNKTEEWVKYFNFSKLLKDLC
jgi:hypothetical protein